MCWIFKRGFTDVSIHITVLQMNCATILTNTGSPLAQSFPMPLPNYTPVVDSEPAPPENLRLELVNRPEVSDDFFTRLGESIPAPLGTNDCFMFTQIGSTVQQAAKLFVQYLQHFTADHFGMGSPPLDVDKDWHDVMEVCPQSLAGLLMPGHQSWR